MSTPPLITVVVPTYQRARTIRATIDAVLDQDIDAPFELIVVDNGSTDDTASVLERYREHDRLRVIRLDPNRGPTPARNAGWNRARAPVVAFTDDDCVPDRGWLRAILAATDRGADVVMGRTIPDPEQLSAGGPFSHWVRVEEPMPWFPTCNIAYRRQLLVDLGGFDETFTARLGSSFGDDTDLGWRALEAGAEARFVDDAVVVHEVTPSDFRTWLAARRRRAGVPEVLVRHPGLRAQLPSRWSYDRGHPPAVLAACGLTLLVLRPRRTASWLLAAAAARPYVAHRWDGPGRRWVAGGRTPRAIAGLWLADVVEAVVVGWESAKRRLPLL